MAFDNSGEFGVFSGTVSQLTIVSSKKELDLLGGIKEAGGITAVALAVMGEPAANTALQSSTGDTTIEFEEHYFRCKIGDRTVYGCFPNVFFADGDEVDVVATREYDGNYHVYAVRRPIDHRLWLADGCEQGITAFRMSRVKASFYMSLFIWVPTIVLLTIMLLFNSDGGLQELLILAGMMLGSSLLCLLFLVASIYHITSRWCRHDGFSHQVFRALGYASPKKVDMMAERDEFIKEVKEKGEFYFFPDSPQYQAGKDKKDAYYYRFAPKVPESFLLG